MSCQGLMSRPGQRPAAPSLHPHTLLRLAGTRARRHHDAVHGMASVDTCQAWPARTLLLGVQTEFQGVWRALRAPCTQSARPTRVRGPLEQPPQDTAPLAY